MSSKYKNKILAVVGVSVNPEKFGFKIFSSLLERGFKVEGVNPKDGEIQGKKIYPTLKDLPQKPDLVITVVPSEITEKIVEECYSLGIKNIWMQPGSESEEAIKKAKEYNIKVTYNSCFMVENGIW